jgi:hypothetical protein
MMANKPLTTTETIAELLQTCDEAARAGGQELMAWRGRFSTCEKGVAVPVPIVLSVMCGVLCADCVVSSEGTQYSA